MIFFNKYVRNKIPFNVYGLLSILSIIMACFYAGIIIVEGWRKASFAGILIWLVIFYVFLLFGRFLNKRYKNIAIAAKYVEIIAISNIGFLMLYLGLLPKLTWAYQYILYIIC